jgi:hypothetical protein
VEALEDRTLPAVSLAPLFVADVFVTEFGRSASPTEIVSNAKELLPGFTASDVANLILSTPSFQAAEVRQLYVKFAGFDPGDGGVSFWSDFLTQSGNTMDTVRVDFLSSDVYFNRVGGTNTAFVSALFGDVWSKPVDTGTLNQSVAALNNGASRRSIASAFVTDPRGYQAQIVADYNKVLDRDPDAGSLNFFTGYRMRGGTNETILAVLHGSSELLKHLEFFGSNTPLTDPNAAAAAFRNGFKSELQNQLLWQNIAQTAAATAQQDADMAAMKKGDADTQLTTAQMDFNDQASAQTAANAAKADWQATGSLASDANNQVMIASTNPNPSIPTEETPAIMQAISDAQKASAAANTSRDQAKKDKDDAQTAADNAFPKDGFPGFLMQLATDANNAAGDAAMVKQMADMAVTAASDDASKSEGDHDKDSENPDPLNANAKDLADDAMEAVMAAQMLNYPDGSQAALLIDAALAAAQGAEAAASLCASFASTAAADRDVVAADATAAAAAAYGTGAGVDAMHPLRGTVDFAVNDALQMLQSGIFDFGQLLGDLEVALMQKKAAVDADNAAQARLSTDSPTNVSSDKDQAHTQLTQTVTAQGQALSDINQAAAAFAAANMNEDHDGDDNSHKRPGGGHQG